MPLINNLISISDFQILLKDESKVEKEENAQAKEKEEEDEG